jgi:hypothetical protein
VEGNLALAGEPSDRRHRLDGTYLGVGVHDRHHDGVGAERAAHVVRVHHAVAVHRHIGGLEALLLQGLHAAQDRVVLHRRGHDVPAAARGGNALHRRVVGLGAAGGEQDLVLAHPEEVRHALARGLDPVARLAAEAWMLEGFPKRSAKYGSIASSTSGCTGVEAL